jgi:hypothetical protein
MSEKPIPKVLLSQVEDALEERAGNDRRRQKKNLPDNVNADRRKGDRRDRPTKPHK